MTNSICIIDDKIPAVKAVENGLDIDDKKQLDSNILKYLLKKEIDWENEIPLRNLITTLVDKSDDWTVVAYTHPHFFVESLKNNLVHPEIIVFDWEYYNKTADSKTMLWEILETCCAAVYIYSGIDQQTPIKDMIESKEFAKFQNRIKYIDKDNDLGTNSEKELMEKITQLKTDNFSFKFGKELRQKSVDAIEKILIELSKIDLSDVAYYLSANEENNNELVEFIGERFKNNLSNLQIPALTGIMGKETATSAHDIAQELWTYRLYFKPTDDLVRCGDIVQEKMNSNHIFFVLSGNCDMNKFWKKNNGYINVVPLYRCTANNEYLKEKKLPTKEMSLESLTSNKNQGTMILPFVRYEGNVSDYLLFPKEIISIKIPQKKDTVKESKLPESLTYKHWELYSRICTLSEPFLAPLINTILNNISGFGVPDYGDTTKNIIKIRVGKALGWNI